MPAKGPQGIYKYGPRAEIWRAVEDHARMVTLVHGQKALDACPRGLNYGPADVCALLAAMVEHGVLRPLRVDWAGVSFSVKAFRTAGPSAGGFKVSSTWNRAEAHLWLYEAVDPVR